MVPQYEYDKNGNLIRKTETVDDGITKVWTYGYDFENRLVKVEIQKAGKIKIVTFTYDPFGRRLSKTVHREEIEDDDRGDEEQECPRTTYYVYDNEDIILEYNHKGKVTDRYLHGPGIDEPLAVEKKHGRCYYHADGLGSITSLTDSKGKVAQRYDYDSFGNLKHQGNKVKQPYTYTGREWDSETGLYYYRARYYDPKVGRFTQKDPIGFAGGDVNLYSYVRQNSVNFIDPKGLETEVTIWQPVGWGQSSFGHVSVNINGTTYSFSPSGMNIIPAEKYLGNNNFRDGVGTVLNITAEQEVILINFLKNYKKEYGQFTNNCADPIESGLEKLGYDVGLILFPVSLGNRLLDLGIARNFNFYSATQSKKGTSAPWAK